MSSKIKFVNAISGGNTLDLWLDSQPFVQHLQPKIVTSYNKVSAGIHIIQVHSNSTSVQSAPLLDYEVQFDKDGQYTLVLVGDPKDPQNVHLSVYTDFGKPPGHGKTMIRIINASPEIKSADLYDNNVKILSNIMYDTPSEYVVVDAKKTTNFALTATGSLIVILGPINIKLDSNCIYTLILYGNVTDSQNPLTILSTKDCYNALTMHL